MAKKIQVTPEQLKTAAGKIEQCAREYKGLYDSLYSKTDGMGSSWSGEDNKAFINQINDFKPDLEQMKALMDEYAFFLRKSAEAYETTQGIVVKEATKLVN